MNKMDPNNVFEVFAAKENGRVLLNVYYSNDVDSFVRLDMDEHATMELIGYLKDALKRLRTDNPNYHPDFRQMYHDFEKRYNPYPVQMSREEAFTKAKIEGLIDQTVWEEAKKYFGKLWNYVGD